ncbi:MAG: RNase adapter RapZ [Rhodospirillales bacterium]
MLVTGLSGAGKTTALKALEDLGYEAVDHLPLYLLPRLLKPLDGEIDRLSRPLAIGVDVRTRDFDVDVFTSVIHRLVSSGGFEVRLVFLYSDDDELVRRYTTSRHRHPLADQQPLMDGIISERQITSPLRACADITIDTTALPPAELKQILSGHFGHTEIAGLAIHVMSFSFRSGLPRQADLVFDVRFLDNPFYQSDLRGLTGRDSAVARHIASDPAFDPFFHNLTCLLEPLLPRYHAEGKSYLTIAIGCTGGRHRSVFVAERLAGWLSHHATSVQINHRDLGRSGREGSDAKQDGNRETFTP